MRRHRRYLALPLFAAFGAIAACSSDSAPTDPDLASQLEHDTGTKWNVYVDPQNQEVRFLAPEAPVSIGSGSPEEKARAFFARYRTSLHASGKADELTAVSTLTDPRGGMHIRFEHTLPGTGLPVFHAGTTAHFTPDGSVYWLRTDFRADLAAVDPTATLTKDGARSAAIARVKSSCGASRGEPIAIATELGVLSDPERPAALAFRVALSAESADCIAPLVFIDAKTGGVLSLEETAHRVATATAVEGSRFFRANDNSDKKKIDISVSGTTAAPKYSMVSEDAPNQRVFTHSFGSARAIETTDPKLWDATATAQGAAVDAHYNTRQGLSFLRAFQGQFQAHQRAAIPPLGTDVHVFVHDNSAGNSDGENAFARYDQVAGTDVVHLGDGAFPAVANALPYSAAYDVVAHELTHLITEHTSGLSIGGEPGALNESFSDVMGAAAEHAVAPNDAKNFLIGEGLYIAGVAGPTALRSMTAPASLGSPDHLDNVIRCPGQQLTSANDFCGVHQNSGIPNRAFSLIVAGGGIYKLAQGKAPELRPVGVPIGIGWSQATELTYWAMTGLAPTDGFQFAALAQMAEGLRQGPEAEHTVACAWYSVGVFSPRNVIESTLLEALCKPPVAPPKPSAPPPPSDVTRGNLCAGHGDSFVCDPAAPAQAVVCKNGAPTVPPSSVLCADPTQACKKVSETDPTAVMVDGVIVCE